MQVLDHIKTVLNKQLVKKDLTLVPRLKKMIVNHEARAFSDLIKIAMENPHFDISEPDDEGVTLLGYAIENSTVSIFEQLLKLGADPNKKSKYSGFKSIREKKYFEEGRLLSPLQQIFIYLEREYNETAAFKLDQRSSLFKMLIALLNHPKTELTSPGINSKQSILADFAKALRLRDLEGLNPKTASLVRLLKQATVVGHRFNLSGSLNIEGHPLWLEGFHLGMAAEEMLKTYQQFINHENIRAELNRLYNDTYGTKDVDYFKEDRTDVDVATLMLTDLMCISHPVDVKQFMERDKQKEITPIYISEPGHAIAYLFYDNYCLRINCGWSSDLGEVPGIKIYQINDKEAMLKEIPTLLESLKRDVADDYLMGSFREKAKLKLIYTIKRPEQTVGNCTFRSFEELLHAMDVMHFFKYFNGLKEKPFSSKFLSFIEFAKMSIQEALQRAEKAGDIAFNLLMHFDKDLGALDLKEIDKYLTDDFRAKIKLVQRQVGSHDRLGKGWNPIYDGLVVKSKSNDGRDPKKVPQKDGNKDPKKVELKADRKSAVENAKEVKLNKDALILTKEQIESFAMNHLFYKPDEIKLIFDCMMNPKAPVLKDLDSDEFVSDDLLIEDPAFMIFKANIDGLKSISFNKDLSVFQLEMQNNDKADQFMALIDSLQKPAARAKA